MKRFVSSLLVIALIFISVCPVLTRENWDEAFTFIVAADMRFYATEPYRVPKHFLGAVEAIKKIGAGAFMLSPGDFDPPQAVREILSIVLGPDYLWYPVIGNHETDSTSYVEWLRNYNKDGTTLPHIVRKGPVGCEETTYSFDWANCHFVALNQYYDGKSDMAKDGDIVPELLVWLEEDLAANTKKHTFVCAHEPIISVPDMDNGRIRHQGDSLDKYPNNAFSFHQLLFKYGVRAYICGHTHSTSFANINGVWQIDVGHARGIEEDSAPEELFEMLSKVVEECSKRGLNEEQSLKEFYDTHQKQVKKAVYYMRLAEGDYYDNIADTSALQGLSKFYFDYRKGGETKAKHIRIFWENSGYRKSSFFKFYAGKDAVKVEIYRDNARGGAYSLRHTMIID